ncbi:DUF5753 domain-containing protein [Nocardiopsis potens]|uniref:DUF5753 domain-containing protein n=1 Tax=Nocardiopsis potens TaxID=1246458 RepID=UPI000594512F|nr:DUF5753 domain-containing protein [Nocardiopsis potens]
MGDRLTVARWELAKRLRRLRGDRGFNAVAKAVRVAPSSLARWETPGENGSVPGLVALERLLQHYEVDEETFNKLIKLRSHAKKPNWWQEYELQQYHGTFISLEEAATSISSYQSTLIPGLFQTEEYMRSVIKATRIGEPQKVVDALTEVRLERQQKWWKSEGTFWGILGETALTQLVGGPQVMRKQLEYLHEVSQHPRVTMQVLPFNVGAHAALDVASFVILSLGADDLSTVYQEGASVSIFLDEPADLERYDLIFNRLRAAALDTSPTRELFLNRVHDLES